MDGDLFIIKVTIFFVFFIIFFTRIKSILEFIIRENSFEKIQNLTYEYRPSILHKKRKFPKHSPHRKWLICPPAEVRWLHRAESLDVWTFWNPNLCLVQIGKRVVTPWLWSLHAWHSEWKIWIWRAPPIYYTTPAAGRGISNLCFPRPDLWD